MLSFRAIKDMMFADQGLVDDRQPLMAFEIPGLDGRWGFYLPKIDPWKVLLIVSGICFSVMRMTVFPSPCLILCHVSRR